MKRISVPRWWHTIRLKPRFAAGALVAGRYRIIRQLGQGNYGLAYLCEDRTLSRSAVLKVSIPARGGMAKAKRTHTWETEIMARLDHPGIPKLFETFEIGGYPCFTMEYVNGDSLDALLFRDNRSFTEEQSLQLIAQLLPIVQYLHTAGIIHRDISIANVLINDDGSIRLVDYGLARPLPERSGSFSMAPDEPEPDLPTFSKLKRQIRVTSDFYAIGHLLLFLLYSSYSPGQSPGSSRSKSGKEPGWEEELDVTPQTKRLIRRLLMTEQPFASAQEILAEVNRIQSGRQDMY